jgi:YbgC/YbaW family acyl-CoA thioester hydrolase
VIWWLLLFLERRKIMAYSVFETEVIIRPDDIDMNNHVHNSRYLDLVLAARFHQMKHNYGMTMEEFVARGFGWVVAACFIQFKRPLVLGDIAIVKTGIDTVGTTGAKVRFEILRKETMKVAADGYFDYTMVNLKTGRAEKLPEDIITKYSI